MLLLQFDPAVDVYTPQPLTLPYRGLDGQMHRYTPDGLIQWRSDHPVHDPRPVLVEIKYREAFKGDWRRWRAIARAARIYAHDRGWIFHIYTEQDIRTPVLENVRFLLPYLRRSCVVEGERRLLDGLEDLSESTPRDVISVLCQDKWDQAALIPVLWKLLAMRSIGFDLTQPLTMQSPIWSLRR